MIRRFVYVCSFGLPPQRRFKPLFSPKMHFSDQKFTNLDLNQIQNMMLQAESEEMSGKTNEAIKSYEKCIKITKDIFGSSHDEGSIRIKIKMAQMQMKNNNWTRALELYQDALQSRVKKQGAYSESSLAIFNIINRIVFNSTEEDSKSKNKEEKLNKLVDFYSKKIAQNVTQRSESVAISIPVSNYLLKLSQIYMINGNMEEGQKLWRSCHKIYQGNEVNAFQKDFYQHYGQLIKSIKLGFNKQFQSSLSLLKQCEKRFEFTQASYEQDKVRFKIDMNLQNYLQLSQKYAHLRKRMFYVISCLYFELKNQKEAFKYSKITLDLYDNTEDNPVDIIYNLLNLMVRLAEGLNQHNYVVIYSERLKSLVLKKYGNLESPLGFDVFLRLAEALFKLKNYLQATKAAEQAHNISKKVQIDPNQVKKVRFLIEKIHQTVNNL